MDMVFLWDSSIFCVSHLGGDVDVGDEEVNRGLSYTYTTSRVSSRNSNDVIIETDPSIPHLWISKRPFIQHAPSRDRYNCGCGRR
jgi:hypothetical protein